MNLAIELSEIEKQVSALISENINLKTENTSLLTSVENLNKSVQAIENNLTEAKKLIKGMNKYLSTQPEFWSKEERFEIAELSEKAYQFVTEEENGR